MSTNLHDEVFSYGEAAARASRVLKIQNRDDPSIYNRRIGYARTFVALQNDDQAEKELSQILAELPSKSKLRRQVQLAIAGLQAKHMDWSKSAQ